MGMYTLEEITKKWRRGKLTSEQAIGQLIQIVAEMNQRLGTVEKHLFDGSTAKATRGINKQLPDN